MTVQIRSILAATDLSPTALEVVRGAASLAELTGAELHLLHAVEPPRGLGGESVLDLQRRTHDARAALQAHADAAAPQARVASAHVAVERAATAILERAGEVGADLLVIGPHRTRPVGDQILGTTADRLVRESRVPCLIVRGPLAAPLRRVVLPSDLSEVARGALAAGLQWAAALQGATPPAEGAVVQVVNVAESAGATGLEREVAAARKLVGTSPQLQVAQKQLQGSDPAEAILSFTRENPVDLLVMGTRGERPLIKALLGSVSAAVAREAEVPLLLIPPAVWKEQNAAAPTALAAV